MSNNNNSQSPSYNPIIAQYNPAVISPRYNLPNMPSSPPNMPSSPPNNAGYVMNDYDGETGTPPVQLSPNGLRLDQLQEGRTYKLVGSFRMYNATRGVSGNPHLPLRQDLVDFQTIGLRMRDRSPIFGPSGQTEYTVTFENFAETFSVAEEDLTDGSYFIDVTRNTPTTQSTLTPLTMNSPSSPSSPVILRANSPPPPAPAYEYPPESPVPKKKPTRVTVTNKNRLRMMGGKRKTKKGKKSRKGKSRRHRKY